MTDAQPQLAAPAPDSPRSSPNAASHWVDLNGPVHYLDHPGPDGPPLVLVHGLGGSHVNYMCVTDALSARRRVLVPDLAGFGLTTGHPRSAAVGDNVTLLSSFLERVVGGPVVLVGHSMGGLIAALTAARHPHLVARLVLIDPALPIGASLPDPMVARMFAEFVLPAGARRLLQRARPRTFEQYAEALLRVCFADQNAFTPQISQQHLAVAQLRRGDRNAGRDFGVAAASLAPYLGRGRAKLHAAMDAVDVPVLLLHGRADRLVPIKAAEQMLARHPQWSAAFAPGVGHIPMLEAPDWTAQQILDWLTD